jgi:acyl-homoserine lactone acylase PvdQ
MPFLTQAPTNTRQRLGQEQRPAQGKTMVTDWLSTVGATMSPGDTDPSSPPTTTTASMRVWTNGPRAPIVG